MEKRFGISDAARQVGVEAHVLRYWEVSDST
jgi:DNA-binding transcriptional MerR regulator